MRLVKRLGVPTAVVLLNLVLLVASGCPAGPTAPPRPALVALRVVNNSSEDIAYLFVSPQDSESWGEDLLGVENDIPAGQEFTVYVPPGVYDLMVQNYRQEEIGRKMGVVLTEDSQWLLYDEQ